jgi:hypothetical protein
MRTIIEIYAMRAREFSDAVARLGKHKLVTPEFLQAIAEINARHALCISAKEQLDELIRMKANSADRERPMGASGS